MLWHIKFPEPLSSPGPPPFLLSGSSFFLLLSSLVSFAERGLSAALFTSSAPRRPRPALSARRAVPCGARSGGAPGSPPISWRWPPRPKDLSRTPCIFLQLSGGFRGPSTPARLQWRRSQPRSRSGCDRPTAAGMAALGPHRRLLASPSASPGKAPSRAFQAL